jgi:hypothetical protein
MHAKKYERMIEKTDRGSIEYIDTIGFVADSGGRGFSIPVDMTFGQSGRIYVVNRSPVQYLGIRVSVCDIDHGWYGEFGSYGTADGQFSSPSSIAYGPGDRIYVADEELNRVTVFTAEGEFVSKWGQQGNGDGQLHGPSALKFNKYDELLVVDHRNSRVQTMTCDGDYISQFGSAGSSEGQFDLPWGLDVDQEGRIYVADWRNDRIQRFTAEGEFIETFGTSGDGVNEFHRPSDVAVDEMGLIYVTDWGNQRVQIFDNNWELRGSLRGQATLSKWSSEYIDANEDELRARSSFDPYVDVGTAAAHEASAKIEPYFWDPIAVEIDSKGRAFVVDSLRHRLQIFRAN